MSDRLLTFNIKKPSTGLISKATARGGAMPSAMTALEKQMSVVLKMLEKKHEGKMFSNPKGIKQQYGTNKLGVRSGKLKRSFKNEVSTTSSAVIGKRGSKHWYAHVHEHGETIKAKGDGWMWIPVGGHKMSPTAFRDRQHFYMKSKDGAGKTAMLITGKGKGKSVSPMFALRKEVVIPKRDILLQSALAMRSAIGKRFSQAVANVLEGK